MGARWTDADRQMIVKNYAHLGAHGLASLLPGRTAQAIMQQAHRLGVADAFKIGNSKQFSPLPAMTDWERRACRSFRQMDVAVTAERRMFL